MNILAAANRVQAAASTVEKPNTREIGSASGATQGIGILSWAALGSLTGAATEQVPELHFPMSAVTYSRMRNDSQIDGLLKGTMLPITQYDWYIDPNGADDAVVEKIADDLGLPIGPPEDREDRPTRRFKRRFNFNEHLRLALLALPYGFYFFEQVYEYSDTDQMVHLRKLAERPPWSITEINTEKDGGLKEIKQGQGIEDKPIPITALLAYSWEKEGGNWLGRSILRSCYFPWLLKDRVLRVGAINIERNGAGTPIVEAPPGAAREEIEWLDALARSFRAGSSAGGAIPAGTKLTLKGVEGTQPDSVGFMKFLNEEMARSFLMMFMQLGQTATGSRALGGEFIDFFELAQKAVANWFMAVFNENQIEDDVDINFGEEVPAPLLKYAIISEESPAQELRDKVDEGEVDIDDETRDQLEASTERRVKTSRRRRAESGRTAGEPRKGAVRAANPASPVSLPSRPLRRQPYDHEIAASTDFAALDNAYESALDTLMAETRILIHRQIDELHDAIIDAGGDLDDIVEISASSLHDDVIAARLISLAEIAAQQATDEAQRQGVSITRPTTEELRAGLEERARIVSTMIARDVTASATRNALRLTGGGLEPTEVADEVATTLREMTWAGIRDQLGGVLAGAQNAGRSLVFRRDGQNGRIYSSELLDVNTCGPCASRDGAQYDSLDAALRDYPTGSYKDCDGRERCRGTLVKVYTSETPSTLEVPFGG